MRTFLTIAGGTPLSIAGSILLATVDLHNQTLTVDFKPSPVVTGFCDDDDTGKQSVMDCKTVGIYRFCSSAEVIPSDCMSVHHVLRHTMDGYVIAGFLYLVEMKNVKA